MQTYLHGRDMITTQEWTKDELDTVMDVAMDLKRKRALGELRLAVAFLARFPSAYADRDC